MTVCIAILCERGKKVVTASDHMLSMQAFSGDGLALKDDPIHHNWYAMWANNVAHIPAILHHLETVLPGPKEHEWVDVAKAFTDARDKVLNEEISNRVLRRHGYTQQDFRQNGKMQLTPSRFNALHDRISAVKLEADFLVYGFDPRGDGHIFTVDDDGSVKSSDKAGFWAIGSGAYAALSSLFYAAKRNGFNANAPLDAALYMACAAKFMAESAEGVGIKTFVSVAEFMHSPGYMPEEVLEKYRLEWIRDYAPRLPMPAASFLLSNLQPGHLMTRLTAETSQNQP